MPRATAKPTARSKSTHRPGRRPVVTAIQWVFPVAGAPLSWLEADRVLLGRDDDCDAVLPSDEISRHHAEIVKGRQGWVLRDLGSTNGIYANGLRVTEAEIEPGTLVRLGDWIGVVTQAPRDQAARPFGEVAPGLFGGPTLASALAPLGSVAPSDLSVIVEGETGTGKERVAAALHAMSGRTGSFLAVNCAALPASLAEAELFGYRKGAFTGADRSSPGYFREAHQGTLLLDEIAELQPVVQAKLLRVIEQREVLPLGEARAVPVDVRVVAAAQRPLDACVAAGDFRADLLARLDGLTLRLPPLRERIEDVPFLTSHFVHVHATGDPPALDAGLVERLCLHDWPFNVRELLQLVRRLLVLHGREPFLRRAHLPEKMLAAGALGRDSTVPNAGAAKGTAGRAPRVRGHARDRSDVQKLAGLLRTNGGNVAQAATEIGISRQRAYRPLEQHPEVDLGKLRDGE